MADLVVDLGLLESTAGALSMLMEEFNNASKIVDDYQGDIGDPRLLSALDDFASNWKVHRQTLLSSMDAVYKMATTSHKAYVNADDKLARDIKGDKTAPTGTSS
jgi:hypothetical protein